MSSVRCRTRLSADCHSVLPESEIKRLRGHMPVLRCCCYVRVPCQAEATRIPAANWFPLGSGVFSTAVEVTLGFSILSWARGLPAFKNEINPSWMSCFFLLFSKGFFLYNTYMDTCVLLYNSNCNACVSGCDLIILIYIHTGKILDSLEALKAPSAEAD